MKRNPDNFEARITRNPKPSKSGHERWGYAAWIREAGQRLGFATVVHCDHAHKTESAATQCGKKLLADTIKKQLIENQERDERQARREGARS